MPIWLQIVLGVAAGVAVIGLILALVLRAERKRAKGPKLKRYRGHAEEPGGSYVPPPPYEGQSGDGHSSGGHSH